MVDLSDFDARHPSRPPPNQQTAPAHDPDYEGSRGVRDALAAVDRGDPAILVHGGGGVGKTHLVNYLRTRPGSSRQVVVAPTGIAAINGGGQTIHSFFRLPPRFLDPKNLESAGKGSKLWRKLNRVVIDEISMVRVDLLDAIDARLRNYRRKEVPFGGAQVLMVGDPLQLPPIVRSDDGELLRGLGYATPFLHSALSFRQVKLTVIKLDKVFRQDDLTFIHVLNSIRRGEDLVAATSFLNEQCVGPHRPGPNPLLLTPTRAAADRYNEEGLEAVQGERRSYSSATTGKFNVQKDRLPAPELLTLKVGAEVMAVRNRGSRWLNGSRGQVVELLDNAVKVRFHESGEVHEVARETWENVRQKWDPVDHRVTTEVIGTYAQIPLILGWAVTIHKAQGLTLADVRIDLGWGTFASGQLYVALSRAKSLEGLSLTRPLRPSDVRTDSNLVAFVDWLERPT